MRASRVAAHAKINLRLVVLAQETSGYHQIETIFCRLELADVIEIAPAANGIELEVSGAGDAAAPDLGPPGQNLVVRAAEAFFAAAAQPPAISIRLRKHIPAGAGLGGGSSDAAAVLRALNRLYGEPLEPPRLLRTAARLGSDVPFFVAGGSLALAWGRGDRLLPLPPLPPRPVLLALPGVHVSTADAYAELAAARTTESAAPTTLIAPRDWADVARLATNDFESVIFARLPRLAAVRDAIAAAGAAVARMTGSGSVVFGIFDGDGAAEESAARLREQFPDTRFLVTRTHGQAVPGGGFEPPLADPKSAVLPLDDPGAGTEN